MLGYLVPGLVGRTGKTAGGGTLLFGIDDIYELWLKGSPAHEEAIHIRLARQLLAGCSSHRTWEGRRKRE